MFSEGITQFKINYYWYTANFFKDQTEILLLDWWYLKFSKNWNNFKHFEQSSHECFSNFSQTKCLFNESMSGSICTIWQFESSLHKIYYRVYFGNTWKGFLSILEYIFSSIMYTKWPKRHKNEVNLSATITLIFWRKCTE